MAKSTTPKKPKSTTQSTKKKPAKYKKFDVDLIGGPLTLYASPKVLDALEQATMDMTLWQGVKLAQVLKAVYNQGLKDGRREVIEKLDVIKDTMNYLPPGQPKKTKKK